MRGDAGAVAREPGSRKLTSTYLAVVVVEALVILALWSFSQYFG